jgi:hypothetical protein
MNCICKNLFRDLPEDRYPFATEEDEDEKFEDASFEPHLHAAYDLALRVLSTAKKKLLTQYMDDGFIYRLISRFDSCDRREHICVQIIIRSLYKRFNGLRDAIVQQMNLWIMRYLETETYERKYRGGVSEMLEIYSRIFDAIKAESLRESHWFVWWRAILPLHKSFYFSEFREVLNLCVVAFLKKTAHASRAFDGYFGALCKYWPYTNYKKQMHFLQAIAEVLNNEEITVLYGGEEDEDCVANDSQTLLMCIRQAVKLIGDGNMQVSHQALIFLMEDQIVPIVDTHKYDIWPEIIMTVTGCEDSVLADGKPINDYLIESREELLRMMRTRDRDFFGDALADSVELADDDDEKAEQKKARESRWRALKESAKRPELSA